MQSRLLLPMRRGNEAPGSEMVSRLSLDYLTDSSLHGKQCGQRSQGGGWVVELRRGHFP